MPIVQDAEWLNSMASLLAWRISWGKYMYQMFEWPNTEYDGLNYCPSDII